MQDNIQEAKPGKRLTFSRLLTTENYHVEIPIIQRDYAQGRPGQEDVRSTFLDALYNYLEENKPNRDLDFIYGSLTKEEGADYTKFIPLDGQQRLTTLFLLHWYLASKEGRREELLELLKHQNKSKFSYETRTSSREFCDALVGSEIAFDTLLEGSLAKSIQDCNWYYLSWENDPTIQSMLIMLDAIHERFKDATGFFERLMSSDNPVITFQFLDLEEFNLTDDLYIKMNARGKPLTDFENFKAKFEQLIKATDFDASIQYQLQFGEEKKDATVQEYFSYRIDIDWANLFWNYKDENNNFDDKIMNFIRAATIARYASLGEAENVKYLIKRDEEKSKLTFLQYIKLSGFDENFILDFIDTLDALKNGNNKVINHNVDPFFYDEAKIFEQIIDNKLNYPQRLQFHAYCQYLITNDSPEGLESWMRVIHNLSENTIYNSETEFINAIKSINELLSESTNIIEYLSKSGDVSNFSKLQVEEEKIKAQLLLVSDTWHNTIINAEKHKYFKGQIGFLLSFSGIKEYYQNHNNTCVWNEADNNNYLNQFNSYYQKADAVFGGKDGPNKFEDYLWERALLSKGDYLLVEGQNHSFSVYNNDRDISWKRLLLDGGQGERNPAGKNTSAEKRNLVKVLFDDSDFDITLSDFGLSSIIDKVFPSIKDWRRVFVEYADQIDYLKPTKRYIRRYSNNHIYLFSKERLSGLHADSGTSHFFAEHEDLDTKPFKEMYYMQGSGWDYPPHIALLGYEYKKHQYSLNIYNAFEVNEESGETDFILNFTESEARKIHKDFIQVMEGIGFEKLEDNLLSCTLTKSRVLQKIKDLCTALNNL